ncbi:MAG: GlsB/YeaQ/YmgE family stress response membrane protein [Gammaproteobacteria bacterium]|nr:GlsB/YeaQ/YmgE family stress response membrane protein [Gammaproteobacteria bacterium]
MNMLAWIVLGVLSGYGASRLSNIAGPTYLADVLVGMAGAVLGGLGCVALAAHPSQPFDVTSLLAAGLAAALALRAFHVWFPRKLATVVKRSTRWH